MSIELYHGDCLEVMKKIPNESVDFILTDPPYGTIKGLKLKGNKRNEWDNKPDLQILFDEYFRVLKPQGKVIIFSQNKFTQELRSYSSTYLEYLYPLIWVKDNFANYLSVNKSPVQIFEDMSVFGKEYGLLPKSKAYAKQIKRFINLPTGQILKEIGNRKADHFLRTESLQFSNVSEEGYQELINVFGIDKMDGFLEYRNWLDLYNGERTKTRAKTAFNLPEGKKHVKNLFEINRDADKLHPTQKPVDLLGKLIEIYTESDAIVLDNYMGSGSTGVACKNTGRNFIGIELDNEYFKIAKKRIESHEEQLILV